MGAIPPGRLRAPHPLWEPAAVFAHSHNSGCRPAPRGLHVACRPSAAPDDQLAASNVLYDLHVRDQDRSHSRGVHATKSYNAARAIKPMAFIVFLPFMIVAVLIKWLTGFPVLQNFAWPESAGRFRRIRPDAVYATLEPLETLLKEANDLAGRSDVQPMAKAQQLIADAHKLAGRIEAVCDDFEGQNFSFAHKRRARLYRQIISHARAVAADLRKSGVEPVREARQRWRARPASAFGRSR